MTKRIDLAINYSRIHLFNFADRLKKIHESTPFSSILVEDTSGRFTGLFIREAIGKDHS